MPSCVPLTDSTQTFNKPTFKAFCLFLTLHRAYLCGVKCCLSCILLYGFCSTKRSHSYHERRLCNLDTDTGDSSFTIFGWREFWWHLLRPSLLLNRKNRPHFYSWWGKDWTWQVLRTEPYRPKYEKIHYLEIHVTQGHTGPKILPWNKAKWKLGVLFLVSWPLKVKLPKSFKGILYQSKLIYCFISIPLTNPHYLDTHELNFLWQFVASLSVHSGFSKFCLWSAADRMAHCWASDIAIIHCTYCQ